MYKRKKLWLLPPSRQTDLNKYLSNLRENKSKAVMQYCFRKSKLSWYIFYFYPKHLSSLLWIIKISHWRNCFLKYTGSQTSRGLESMTLLIWLSPCAPPHRGGAAHWPLSRARTEMKESSDNAWPPDSPCHLEQDLKAFSGLLLLCFPYP